MSLLPFFEYGIYDLTISETLAVNSSVLQVNANDEDAGACIWFSKIFSWWVVGLH